MLEGSCLCGAIRYRITEEPTDFGYCHCASCRKGSGSAFGANMGVDRAAFELSDPQRLLKEYESSPGKLRCFCSHCGSPLFAYLRDGPAVVRVRLGSLDTPLGRTARAHSWVSDKADWELIEDSLPQFDEWADRGVLVQRGSRQP